MMIISRTRLPRFQVRLKNFCCHHGTTLDLLVGNAILIRTSRRTRLRSSVCAFISKKKQKSVVFRVSNHCARCYHTKLVSSSDIRNRRCLRTDPYLQGAHSSLWPIVIVSLSPARDNMSIVTEKVQNTCQGCCCWSCFLSVTSARNSLQGALQCAIMDQPVNTTKLTALLLAWTVRQ